MVSRDFGDGRIDRESYNGAWSHMVYWTGDESWTQYDSPTSGKMIYNKTKRNGAILETWYKDGKDVIRVKCDKYDIYYDGNGNETKRIEL